MSVVWMILSSGTSSKHELGLLGDYLEKFVIGFRGILLEHESNFNEGCLVT